jgi:hypothetical protein
MRAVQLRGVFGIVAVLGSAVAVGQISTDEAMARLKAREAARQAETKPAAVKPTPATRPAAASQPAAVELQASVDGVPFGEVTYPSANDHPPKAHARLSDVAQLLLCPPGKTGIKFFNVDRSTEILKRRLPLGMISAGCEFFASDVGGADVALFHVEFGVVARIILCYRNPATPGRMLDASYGSSHQSSPWRGDGTFPAQ